MPKDWSHRHMRDLREAEAVSLLEDVLGGDHADGQELSGWVAAPVPVV